MWKFKAYCACSCSSCGLIFPSLDGVQFVPRLTDSKTVSDIDSEGCGGRANVVTVLSDPDLEHAMAGTSELKSFGSGTCPPGKQFLALAPLGTIGLVLLTRVTQ